MLKGRVAVVTGGSSGIGAAVCVALAREGASVVVVASHDQAKARQIAEQIVAAGGQAEPLVGDVRKCDDVEAIFAAAERRFGGVDILVNAAGVYCATPIEETPEDDVDRLLDINVKGTWNTIARAVPRMKARGGGRIVNLTSVAAFVGLRGFSLYCASKAAIQAMTRSLALELAPLDININAIAPGNTATPLNAAFRTDPANADYLAAMTKATPSRTTFSTAEEIADAVVFVVARGRAMHGSTLLIDEGLSAGIAL